MISSRLAFVFSALVFAAGCAVAPQAPPSSPPSYYRVMVTDLRGMLVARWVAEGPVWRREDGCQFDAVERTSAPPFPVYSRYPHGRRVRVSGPNVTITRIGQPAWLREQAVRPVDEGRGAAYGPVGAGGWYDGKSAAR